ncbi:MFS transporter [Actinorhabdospora filicis]|uniref:MFS transporter n=1 Tax=Actinorhabdospora filicis TaxID=1785913 RepID=A0A9W6W716_9ACTN|nr:MFS transporter [Actinorhabdospora filicis]GLZ75503.1 MFS transporter [Actinorhabdospora filicis]
MTAATGVRSLWRHGDFMRLWSAQTLSLAGTQVTQIALPIAAITLLDATPWQLGLLAAAQYLPFLLVGLPAGVWVDRWRRRPVLVTTDLARAAVLAVLPLAYLFGGLHLWMLYPVGFAVGILTVFFDIAHQSYLPSLVDRDHLVDGNGKLEASYQGAQLAGPGAGGVIVQVLTAPVALFADAVSYLFSALLLGRIKAVEPVPEPHPEDAHGLLRGIGVGLRYVLKHPLLRPIALATAIGNLFGIFGIVQAVLTLFAIKGVGLTAGWLGLALGIANAGALLGALANRRIVAALGLGPVIVASVTLPGAAILLLPLAREGFALPVLAVALAIAWFGIAVYNVNQISLRQAVVPTALQGRMNATMRFLIWGTIPLGTALGGFLGGAIGLRSTLLIAGAGAVLSALPVLLSPVRALRAIPERDGDG